ncbi:hypothetical protein LVJ94_04165 [Pendulispora rubella]|uniref:Uncharacterized protein n=1 Tax=Pendulispora rubella TaxID=2741070 RepID=A0ABZ2L681_9BACT
MKRIGVIAAAFLVLGVTVAGCGDASDPAHHGGPDTGDRIPRISGLAFVTPPMDSATDLPLAPTVRIAVVDDKGVPFKSWTAPITISLSGNTTGAVLAGQPTVKAVEGTGEFEGLSVNVAGTYSLVASTPGLAPLTSRPFVISNYDWFVPGQGLEGAGAGTVTVDPSSPSTLYFSGVGRYVSGGNGGVFTSTTRGKTWSAVGKDLPRTARVVGVDPGSSAVYALDNDDHAWRSNDGGASWTNLNFGMPVSSVAVDARTKGSIWATGTNASALYHSATGGGQWTEVNANAGCSQLDIDPTDSNILLCNAGRRRSRDGGTSFENVEAGLPSLYNTWFHHVDHAGNVYSVGGQCSASSCTGVAIRKLVKGSSTWRTLTGAGLGDLQSVRAIATSPSNSLTVYAIGSEGLYKSLDGGETFASTGNTYLNYTSLTIDPNDPAVVYASAYDGPVKSTDGGRTFNPIVTGLHNIRVDRLAVGAGASPTIYALAYPGGILRSADGGRTWSSGNIGAKAIATDPVHAGGAWIHSANGSIWRTTDGGTSWQEVSAKGPDAVAMLSDGTNLWAADEHATAWKSTDGGKQWFVGGVGLPGNANALMLDPKDPKTLYAATAKGFAKSTNGGASWSNSSHCSKTTIGPDRGLLSMAISGSYLYMGATDGHLYVSTDRGETCQFNMIFGAGKISGLAVDPNDPSTVMAATELQGIYRITGGGQQVSPSNAGTRGLSFNDVIATPAWGLHTFFAASSVYGIFENSSGGR